jgi:GDPmannose 4,6-dehydratase
VTFPELVRLMVDADLAVLGVKSPNQGERERQLLAVDNAFVRQPNSVMVD